MIAVILLLAVSGVPVLVVPSASVHDTLDSTHVEEGWVSVMEPAAVIAIPRAPVSLTASPPPAGTVVPTIEALVAPEASAGEMVKPKVAVVAAPVFFTILRKPPPGVVMQSNGLLLPPLPADGYEQTFTRSAPAGRIPPESDFLMSTSSVESFG